MAYDHTQYEVFMANDVDLNSGAAILATWAPGLVPHMIRGLAVTVTNAIGAAGSLTFEIVTANGAIDSGTDAGIIVLPNTTAIGKVVYDFDLDNVQIYPGQELIVHSEDVCAASDTGNVHIFVEPRWATPGNIAAMQETT